MGSLPLLPPKNNGENHLYLTKCHLLRKSFNYRSIVETQVSKDLRVGLNSPLVDLLSLSIQTNKQTCSIILLPYQTTSAKFSSNDFKSLKKELIS